MTSARDDERVLDQLLRDAAASDVPPGLYEKILAMNLPDPWDAREAEAKRAGAEAVEAITQPTDPSFPAADENGRMRVPKPRMSWWGKVKDRFSVQPVPARIGGLVTAIGIMIVAAIRLIAPSFGPQAAIAKIVQPIMLATGAAPGVHMLINVRDTGVEEFDHVDLKGDMVPMEVWMRWPVQASDPKQPPTDPGRMRVEKQGRIYNYDGVTSRYYWPAFNMARELKSAKPRFDAFWPAAWLQQLTDLPRGCKIVEQREADGEGILRISLPAPKGEAPVERGWFNDFAREVEIRWSLETKQLTGLRRWVEHDGRQVLVTESTSIQYMPQIGDEIFKLSLPEGVRMVRVQPGTPELDALGPREAAERFWRAAIGKDWAMVEIFCPSHQIVDWLKAMQPVELISLGEPAKKESYDGVFVPYQVKYANKNVKKMSIAMTNKNEYGRWIVDGGI